MTHKTTIYLPEELKQAVEKEAQRRGSSEAEVIRDAIAKSVNRPRPQGSLFSGSPIAERATELLKGFGDR
jgi:predicted transcriptional regulator